MREPNTTKNRTKLIVKAALFCLLFTALLWGLNYVKPFFPQRWERAVHGIIGTIAALLSTFLFLKYDKRKFANIGLAFGKRTARNFFTGLLAGILIMGLLTTVVITASGFRVDPNIQSGFFNFMLLSLPLLVLAYMEEVAFRGYPLEILKNRIGIRNTLLITSLLFALYHIANGWSVQDSLLGPGPWGILFGLAALHARGISMATGLHYGVNLVTAAFGINDSSFNIWTLRQKNGGSLENYQSSQWEVLLPQLGILAIAILLMEVYVRKIRLL